MRLEWPMFPGGFNQHAYISHLSFGSVGLRLINFVVLLDPPKATCHASPTI